MVEGAEGRRLKKGHTHFDMPFITVVRTPGRPFYSLPLFPALTTCTNMDRDSPSSLPPTLLEPPPPATIISPPSPTKDKTITKGPSQPDMISSQASPTIESPDSLPQSITGSPPPMSTPLPAPASPAFLRPTSPPFASSSVSITVRSPSPSSPSFRPKGPLHRRTSSAHRVRETIDGTQTANEDGERMINQYKIGMSLGQGAYAKVELGVDINTGVKYVSLTFPISLLSLLMCAPTGNQRVFKIQAPSPISSREASCNYAK